MNWVAVLLLNTLVLSTPLILAAMGGFTSERGGVINIALEGNMLVACIATALVGAALHNPWLGLAGGVIAAVVLSWLHWLLTQTYRMDHIISGMAINAIALGVANYLDKQFTNPNAGAIPALNLYWYYWIAVLLPFLIALYMRFSKGGLRLLASGHDPAKSRQMGLFPSRVRFLGLTATGIFCGLGGAWIVSDSRYYTDEMTAGRGFIALAALILGSWRPIPAMAACLVFGLFQALQIQMQGNTILGLSIPRELWLSLPYLITVIALAGFVGKSRPPSAIGRY